MVQFANLPPKGTEGDDEAIVDMPGLSSSEEGAPNGVSKRKSDDEGHGTKKRKRKSKSEKSHKVNGVKRRHSVSKPARDPRDEAASSPRPKKELVGTRSPSPVIDFDGLSRPSKLRLLLELFTQLRVWKVEEHANGKKRRRNRQLLDCRSSPELCERFSNVLEKTQTERDFLGRPRDMQRLCFSSPKDIRRMYGIL